MYQLPIIVPLLISAFFFLSTSYPFISSRCYVMYLRITQRKKRELLLATEASDNIGLEPAPPGNDHHTGLRNGLGQATTSNNEKSSDSRIAVWDSFWVNAASGSDEDRSPGHMYVPLELLSRRDAHHSRTGDFGVCHMPGNLRFIDHLSVASQMACVWGVSGASVGGVPGDMALR